MRKVGVSRLRKVQAFTATILAIGVAVGTAVLLILERFVAEVDDEKRRAEEMSSV